MKPVLAHQVAAAEFATYRAEAEAELAVVREERDELGRQSEAMAVELREMEPG